MRRPAAPGRLEADVSSDTSQMSHQFLTVLPSAANAFCPQQPWSEQNRRFQDVPPEWSPKCSAHHPADQADDQVRLQAVEAKGSGSCQLEDLQSLPLSQQTSVQHDLPRLFMRQEAHLQLLARDVHCQRLRRRAGV